jgi:hypothetical protein
VSRNLFIYSSFSGLLENKLAFKVFPHDLLNFIGVHCNILLFISDFINSGSFLSSLFNLARGLVILFIFSKKQLFDSLN